MNNPLAGPLVGGTCTTGSLDDSLCEPAIHLGNLPRLPRLPSLKSMALRCLLFSSDEATVQVIRQILTDLGVDAEHCENPVDAVERVTTQLFQIVITDWQDQPEAAFLLKTARDLKASARPLTLAIVGEESRPHALQAGANSVLLKPIRAEQARDTLNTACELLRSKSHASAPAQSPTTLPSTPIASSASAAAAAAPAPVSVTPPEKLRAGEFLQSATLAPGAQFDTENEIRENLETPVGEFNPLTELEPMAASVQDLPEAKPEAKEPLTGWAALQARLTKSAPAPVKDAAPNNELTSYDVSSADNSAAMEPEAAVPIEARAHSEVEIGDSPHTPEPVDDSRGLSPVVQTSHANNGKIFILLALGTAAALVAVPHTRQELKVSSRNAFHAALRWVNPPPATVPQAVVQHDSFGQPDDEYKLPASGNIPDSTTDPSQIQVVPVVDPTAKQNKPADANGSDAQGVSATPLQANNQSGTTPVPNSDQTAAAPAQSVQNQATATTDAAIPATNNAPAAPASAVTAAPSVQQPVQPVAPPPTVQAEPTQPAPLQSQPPQRRASASEFSGIPSSLKSQIASTTPEMSGTKPDDAAVSSIEPVKLPESAVRELLTQPVDPEYPEAAKAGGQAGSVVLQVRIAADGTVQDAKFLQGSFLFARAAIDAVKQWRFKPYSMNGRAVSVQSVVTLNFKPPA